MVCWSRCGNDLGEFIWWLNIDILLKICFKFIFWNDLLLSFVCGICFVSISIGVLFVLVLYKLFNKWIVFGFLIDRYMLILFVIFV